MSFDPQLDDTIVTRIEQGREMLKQELGPGVYDRVVRRTGIFMLTAFVKDVLDTNYPADVFGDDSILYQTWASNDPRAGDELGSGRQWIALLRAAIKKVDR